jgi:hypothetical protein
MSLQDRQQRREALKQQMALAAQHLLAEPDKHVGPGLRLLLGCAADRDDLVVRLALLSLLAVFKDLLPGYRIRSLTEDEQEVGWVVLVNIAALINESTSDSISTKCFRLLIAHLCEPLLWFTCRLLEIL